MTIEPPAGNPTAGSPESANSQNQALPSCDDPGLCIKVPVFEGPMDLLLHLIKVNKIDIKDIPIVAITHQYLEFLEFLKELNLEIAGEFLVMAATLMHIKSQLLLPKPPIAEDEGQDPRQRLMEQLLSYEQFKAAGESLGTLWLASHAMWLKGEAYGNQPDNEELEFRVSLFDLLSSFRSLLEKDNEQATRAIMAPAFSVKEKITVIINLLAHKRKVRFDGLFVQCEARVEMIALFLALLELIRLKIIQARQLFPQGPIWIRRDINYGRSEPESTQDSI